MQERVVTIQGPGPLACASDAAEAGSRVDIRLRRGAGRRDVVALVGELDLATAPQLVPVIYGLLAQGRNRITVDLDDVSFVDAYAVGLLLTAHRDVARAGGSLQITDNIRCARLLDVLGITVLDRRPH